MSKRLSSQYNFAPQLKKHIGDMDVEYVFDRQSVYDRTISLLYKGAKLEPTSHTRSLNDSISCISLETVNKHNLKQTILTNKCQLKTETLLDRSFEVCLGQFEKCSFCEKLGCFIPLKRCFKCNDLYCNNCSFSSDSNDDEALCLSCYK